MSNNDSRPNPQGTPYQQQGGPRPNPYQQQGGPRPNPYQQQGGPRPNPYQQQGGPRTSPYQQQGGPRGPMPNPYMAGGASQSPQKPVKKFDLETVIGKNWMGIMASVLILISMILFAVVLIPYLDETRKLVLMFVVSALFTGFGLFMCAKNPGNVFYLSLSGCGVTALYVSVLMGNMYFHTFSVLGLFLGVLAWSVFVCILSRLQSGLFLVIGRLGLTISAISGVILCSQGGQTATLLGENIDYFALVISYIIAAGLFTVANLYSRKSAEKRLSSLYGFNIICNAVDVFILGMIGASFVKLQPFSMAQLFLIVFVLVQIGIAMFVFEPGQHDIVFGIVNGVFLLQIIALSSSMSHRLKLVDASIFQQDIMQIIDILIVLAILACMEIRYRASKSSGLDILKIACLIFMPICVAQIHFLQEHVGLSILILPVMIFGYVFHDDIYKIAAAIQLGLFAIHYDKIGNMEHLILGVTLLALFWILSGIKKEDYRSGIKNALYGITLFFIINDGSMVLREIGIGKDVRTLAIFFVVSICSAIAMKTSFKDDWIDSGVKESGTTIFTNLVHGILMLVSLSLMVSVESDMVRMFIVLISVANFMMNTLNLMEDPKHSSLYCFYIAAKFTILLLFILSAFEAEKVFVSVSCLVFALVCILLGILGKKKAFRIYGLVVSMICVIKLLMIDIAYENTLGHAIGFFISGVLCFAISMIYNYLDKKSNPE